MTSFARRPTISRSSCARSVDRDWARTWPIAQGVFDQARERREAIERKAKAIKLLYDTLRDTERQAKDAFLGPVRNRVQPYLDLLLPGADLELGQDTLDIHHLHRGDLPSRSTASASARAEQLAILTRLAFADFLRERGQPAAVILDDALAYSDCTVLTECSLFCAKPRGTSRCSCSPAASGTTSAGVCRSSAWPSAGRPSWSAERKMRGGMVASGTLTLPLRGPLPLPQAGEGKTRDEGRRLPLPRAGEGSR